MRDMSDPRENTRSSEPRTVVVSGGTDGIGRGLARRLFARGDRVVAVGSRPEKGAALAAEFPGCDLDPADADQLAESTRRLVSDRLGASPLLPPTDRAGTP
jgi:NAD(P)-dependent dehydrogenase (short-subunit alcohol dehydrogenase family)